MSALSRQTPRSYGSTEPCALRVRRSMFCTRCGLFRWRQVGRHAADDDDFDADRIGECIEQFEPGRDAESEFRFEHGDADPGGNVAADGCRRARSRTTMCSTTAERLRKRSSIREPRRRRPHRRRRRLLRRRRSRPERRSTGRTISMSLRRPRPIRPRGKRRRSRPIHITASGLRPGRRATRPKSRKRR